MVLNKVGLTGATGLLGRHIRTTLEKAGAQVVAVSRENDSIKEVVGWNLKDWQSLKDLDLIFKNVQVVVHAGAMLPDRQALYNEGASFNANIRSSLNLGLWAMERQVPIIFISGAIVYSDGQPLAEEGDLLASFDDEGNVVPEDLGPLERFNRSVFKKNQGTDVQNFNY